MSNKQVFDDYSELCECLKCEHYYNNQCDGIRTVGESGLVEPCKTYNPTRGVIIPKDIKDLKTGVRSLENTVNRHYWYLVVLDLLFVTHLIIDIIRG